jgi:hypothetical protein
VGLRGLFDLGGLVFFLHGRDIFMAFFSAI